MHKDKRKEKETQGKKSKAEPKVESLVREIGEKEDY
jgi:hypothetical protein